MILGLGLEPRKDHTHFRRSLTQVEVMLAKQQNKRILFTFSDLLMSRRPAELLGRWAQDLRIIKKKKPAYALVSGARAWHELRSENDREHFLRVVEKL
jgi:RNase P/RNase MRP subunit p30